ncbi:uncharacterized protein LOC129582072 isoform X2 [Paramacrobiotus metropolitanus]|uniref:uncharacterized protein LOC129582072 isoform X2 n=1 Tax=Paramacrobiotus metropolitanus TaxID=2943436 RepID=UPI0024462701|nr:uncharacterized protein LOC129582072 isoform X2 [Paramacrobiotus metropolitanus]
MGSHPDYESIRRRPTPLRSRGILSLRQSFKKTFDPDTSDASAGLLKRHPVKKTKAHRQSIYELLPASNSHKSHYSAEDDSSDHDATSHQDDLNEALNNSLRLSTGIMQSMSDNSQHVMTYLQINNKPHPNSLGHAILDYLLKQDARTALACTMNTQSAGATRPALPSFDLRRLEPFSASMHESLSDLLKSTGNLYMDTVRRLEDLHSLHEFAKYYTMGHCGMEGSDNVSSYSDASKPVVVSPLELLQRGPEFEDDDEVLRDDLIGKIRAYRQAVVLRKSQAIQRPADTERLFPCVIQRKAAMALMIASVELQDHNIDFDITSIADVAKKYDQLHKRRTASAAPLADRRPSKGVQVRKNRSWPTKAEGKLSHHDNRWSVNKIRDAESERMEWKRMLCSNTESTVEADEGRADVCSNLFKHVATSFD